MRHKFYDSKEYKKKQSKKVALVWQSGRYEHLAGNMYEKKCERSNCGTFFKIKRYDKKVFCSRSCSAVHNNFLRGPMNMLIRSKISRSLRGRTIGAAAKYSDKIIVPRLNKSCLNCSKRFQTPRWQNHKYCSVFCSIRDIGSRITSPKAARGIFGVRMDIDSHICFYSRWEANFARILNLLDIKWEFEYKTFKLRSQKYTPDFYLPGENAYVEIKNFLSPFSLKRDREFRQLYPKEKLILILKKDYVKLQSESASLIKKWEFS